MKMTSVLKKLFIKVVDLANSFPAKAERFLYVKKQLRYVDFKKSHFWKLKLAIFDPKMLFWASTSKNFGFLYKS